MVIGFDAKRAFCNATGLGNYSRMVIGGLAALHPEMPIRLFTPYRENAFMSCFDAYDNIKVIEPKIRIGTNALWRSYGVAKTIRNEALDLFHGLSHELPHGLPENLPTMVTMHDLAVWRYPQFFPFPDRKIYQKKQRYACERADMIIAISEQTKKDLVEILNVPQEKIRVVHQSCQDHFWQPVAEADLLHVRAKYKLPERYALCVGTVEERKNQVSVVKAIKKVDDNLSLVIVGKKRPYVRTVEDEISKLDLSGRVILLEDVAGDDLPALYTSAVCSIYMSVFEGFGIPVLESLCCGTPIVCSNVSSLPEVGGEAAMLADPTDSEAIADAIGRLASDAEFRQMKSTMSRQQAALFTKEKVIADLIGVYSQFC